MESHNCGTGVNAHSISTMTLAPCTYCHRLCKTKNTHIVHYYNLLPALFWSGVVSSGLVWLKGAGAPAQNVFAWCMWCTCVRVCSEQKIIEQIFTSGR